MAIDAQRQLIEVVTQVGQPLGALHDAIKLVAVCDPERAAIQSLMDGRADDVYATELMPDKRPGEFVVISRNKHNAATLAGAA